ncbi:PASTA domain-containing protein, partial [Micromonospora azadirachtae]
PPTRQIPARVGDPRRRRASSWLIALFSAVGVLAVIALVAALLMNGNGEDLRRVPAVTGMTQAQAFQEIQNAGFAPQAGEQVNNSTCEKGKVVSQSPVPDTQLEPTRTVTIQVCGGPAMQTIPDVVDSSFESAKRQLEGLGFVVDSKEKDSPREKNTVLEMDPKPGKEAAEGTKITLTVSKGNVGQVPRVIGATEDDAREELEDAGYRVRVREGSEVPADQAGRVEEQDPGPGKNLPRGREVTIVVTIPAPDAPPTDSGSPTPTATPTTPGTGNGGGSGFPMLPPPGTFLRND